MYNHLDIILDTVCEVIGISATQAKGRDRHIDCMYARYIFFAISTKRGARAYEAVWHLYRSRSLSYHYRQQVTALTRYDKGFAKLLNKAQELYYARIKPI